MTPLASVTAYWRGGPAGRTDVVRLAADENFNADILRGLLRRKPDLDIVRVQDAGLSGADDPTVLEWAAREGQVRYLPLR